MKEIGENELNAMLSKQFEKMGVYSFKIKGALMQRKGMPDFVLVHKGIVYWVEVKVDDNTCSFDQKQELVRLHAHGANVCVARYKSGIWYIENGQCRVFGSISTSIDEAASRLMLILSDVFQNSKL